MHSVWPIVVVLLVCLAFSTFFSGAEIALLSLSKLTLKRLAKEHPLDVRLELPDVLAVSRLTHGASPWLAEPSNPQGIISAAPALVNAMAPQVASRAAGP